MAQPLKNERRCAAAGLDLGTLRWSRAAVTSLSSNLTAAPGARTNCVRSRGVYTVAHNNNAAACSSLATVLLCQSSRATLAAAERVGALPAALRRGGFFFRALPAPCLLASSFFGLPQTAVCDDAYL